MADPPADVRLRPGKEVIDADNIVAHEHESIDQMRADEASTLEE